LGVSPKQAILRAFGGQALVRWIVDEGSSVVYVTDADGAIALRRGGQPDRIIGFPKNDVFGFVDGVEDGSFPDWAKLTKISGQ
jgi:hypothetical protein